jgi:hypothetical protein
MEASILLQLDKAREQGLLLRRADVECRSTACALLLVHATPAAAVRDLTNTLRQSLGFAGISTAEKNIPLVKDGSTSFILGYAEIVLMK